MCRLFNVALNESDYALLERRAAALGVSRSGLVRMLLRFGVLPIDDPTAAGKSAGSDEDSASSAGRLADGGAAS